MKTFSSVLVFLTATLLTASCTQSIDVFQGRTRLRLRINLPTVTEGTFEADDRSGPTSPRYAMIVTDRQNEFVLNGERQVADPVWSDSPRSYQFVRTDGTFTIPLTETMANPQELTLTAESETDLERWVLVRLCRDSDDCSGSSPSGPVRDYLWHLERAFYAGEETRTILPITDLTDFPAEPAPYGCVADEWAAGRTDDVAIELGKCFVFGCAQQSGDNTWGCPGYNLNNSCQILDHNDDPTDGTHSCEVFLGEVD